MLNGFQGSHSEAAIGAATAAPGGAIAVPVCPPFGPATVCRSAPVNDDEVVYLWVDELKCDRPTLHQPHLASGCLANAILALCEPRLPALRL